MTPFKIVRLPAFALGLLVPALGFCGPDIEGYGIFDSHYVNGPLFDDDEHDRFIFKVRRIKFSIEDKLRDNLEYKLAFKVDPEDGEFEWSDAYLEYEYSDTLSADIGRFKIPFGLENNQSTKELPLQERSLASELFTPGRRPGVALYWQPEWAAVYVGSFYLASEDKDYDDGYLNMARAFTHVGKAKKGLLHFGVSQTYQTAVDNNIQLESPIVASGIKDQFESKKYDPQSVTTSNLEWGALFKTLSLQGEWFNQNFDDPEEEFVRWQGGYLQVGFGLSGQGRNYDDGEFSPDFNDKPFSEFTVRLSRVRLEDIREAVEAESLSAAYALYPTKNTKVALQYQRGRKTTVKIKKSEQELESGSAWTLRLQFMF